ncbi:hypothetical protein [Fontibacter flavus]|uniref:Uncharacterized protein n=1 Tax=Fontibacter flavus TaxID=654838 RepID=A0ABV6FUZ8_9BACT
MKHYKLLPLVILLISICWTACHHEDENPRINFDIGIIGEGPFGNFLQFEVYSSPALDADELEFFIGEQLVLPLKLESGAWQVSLSDFEHGVHQLKVNQKSNPANVIVKTFEKAQFLVELLVDESYLASTIEHFLVIWDDGGSLYQVDKINVSGNLMVPLGAFSGNEFTMGIFSSLESAGQGLGQVFRQLPLGKKWPLAIETSPESQFGSASLKLKNLPSHQEYWIGSRGVFSHGQTLSSNYFLFLDNIPSKFFICLNQGSRKLGKFFTDEVKEAGGQVELDLGMMKELSMLDVKLSKPVFGTYSIFGFENPLDLYSQYPLEVGFLEDQHSIKIGDYAEFFPFVEFQLNYQEESTQVFSRFRAKQFSQEVSIFNAGFSVQEKGLDVFEIESYGDFDLTFSVWDGRADEGTDWLVFMVQPSSETMLFPHLILNENIKISDMMLRGVTIEESDLLASYSDYLQGLYVGRGKDYFRKSRAFHSKSKYHLAFNQNPGPQSRRVLEKYFLLSLVSQL